MPLFAGWRSKIFYKREDSQAGTTFESNITHLWLQIAMNDPVILHDLECRQHLHRESPNKIGRESDKVVGFDQLV